MKSPLISTAPVNPESLDDAPALQGKAELDSALFTVRMSSDARSLALGVLSTIAVLFVLDWAQSFIISLLVGILIAYTLTPPVNWLIKIKIPRVLSAGIVMAALVSSLALGAYSLREQVQTILGQLPEAAGKFSEGIADLRQDPPSSLQTVQTAAQAIEKAANQAVDSSPASRQSVTHVIIDQPPFKLSSLLWIGSMGALGFIGQAVMVLFLVFFLLLAGDNFKRKLVRLTGPLLSDKKITLRILDDINASIQKYMFMLLVINVLVGLLTWIALRWIGLENAGAWAVAAGLLHLIPYVGPAVTAAATGLAAFMQFDSFPKGLLVAGVTMAIATAVGTLVATWMTGRIAKMNEAAVFTSLLFWGWLWGVWGMLLSIPIIVIVKVVSQHVEPLQPVSELLGE